MYLTQQDIIALIPALIPLLLRPVLLSALMPEQSHVREAIRLIMRVAGQVGARVGRLVITGRVRIRRLQRRQADYVVEPVSVDIVVHRILMTAIVNVLLVKVVIVDALGIILIVMICRQAVKPPEAVHAFWVAAVSMTTLASTPPSVVSSRSRGFPVLC